MTISKLSVVCAGLMLAGVLPAASDDGNGQPRTVEYFTSAQKTRAFGAATQAGYAPTVVEAFQDGNFFLTASKSGKSYELTIVPSGQVYVSTSIVPVS
jgi:hypothetical protein